MNLKRTVNPVVFSALFSILGGVLALPAAAQIIPIYDIQYTTNPSGDSPMLGQTVTIQGVVTGTSAYGFYIADAPGPWNAIYVYTRGRGCGPKPGDELEVTGKVAEYFGMTELAEISSSQDVSCTTLSTGNTFSALSLPTGSVADEQHESVFVRVNEAVVQTLLDYGQWTVEDGRSPVMVDDDSDYIYAPAVGDMLQAMSGNVAYSFGDFKINPRMYSDINSLGNVPHYAISGTVVTMNDTLQVIENAYVAIRGDVIEDIDTMQNFRGGVPVVPVDGLIFPGLIDAHNHPQYNVLDHIPFGQIFQDRDEWRNHPLYSDFSDQYNGIRDFGGDDEQYDNLWKLAEMRAAAAGTTMIQGSNPYTHYGDAYARRGMGINNVGRHPSHAWSETFPLGDDWDYLGNQYWNRFNIHLSEGVSQDALDEFTDWVNLGMLDERTSIIHGVPYGPTEWAALAAANAHLIWSPRSNWVLYRATANVPQAIAAGVNVALSVDWTPSGSRDLLEEMRFAKALSKDLWGGALTDEWFALSVTRNAALALGIEDRVGQIADGFDADLMVIPGDPADPYGALVESTNEDVRLTIAAGRPLYGDPSVMDSFSFVENLETVSLCGTEKKLTLAVDNHAIPDSERTFGEVLSTLEAAYAASSPKLCDFMGIDPCDAERIFTDDFSTGGFAMWTAVVQ
jgi:hypothetical protein